MAKCDFLTAEVGTAAGEKVPIEGIYDEENSTFSILLTNQLTVEGAISFQIVGYVTEYDTAEPQIITKSPVVSGFITQSINGVEVEADSNPNLLARIWAKIKDWTDKIHTHENYWSLSDLRCVASEVEQGGNNPFPILPDYVGVDRPTYRGNYLSYCSDGAVIGKVEEKDDGEKFLRLWLYKGPLDYNFDVPDFIDIPVALVTERVEEVPGPGLVTNSIGLALDLGVGSGGEGGSSHEHENKDVLDKISIDSHGNLELDGVTHWSIKDGNVIESITVDETTGDITIRERFVPNKAIPPFETKIKQHYKTSELENDSEFVTAEYVTNAINGSLDEIEAMIDESGVLDE